MLPERGEALKLVASDYENAARELGVETAAVHAVATVESGGRTGFDSRKRPKIRYENHYFQRLTHRRYDRSHPQLSCAYNSRNYRLTHGRHSDQYQLLHQAFALAPEAAVQSVSWGMFQVMGENYRNVGWRDLEQFVKDMFYSEGQHMRAFLGFCRHNGLVPYLRNHNWAAFARAYNGPSYAENAYDVKMRNYYQQYSRRHSSH
ncbi:MAG: N-acetylmuramidase family protein [Minicystis sp.]